MEFEDIGRVWREESTGKLRRTRIEDLSTALRRATRYNASVRRRLGLAGKIIGFPLALMFSYLAVRAPNPVVSAGAIILAVLAIVVVLWYQAISRTASDAVLPVRLAIETEVSRLRVLERFGWKAKWGRAVLWMGYFLFTFGNALESTDLRDRIEAIAFSLFVFAIVELLVIRVTRRRRGHIKELREDLESWLRGLEEFDFEGADRC